MSIRKRKQSRDVAVRMGPGEFIDPHDLPHIIPWKCVLDIAAEEIPAFLSSLLEAPQGESNEGHVERWLARWHLPNCGYERELVAGMAGDTLSHLALCQERGIEPEPGFHAHPLNLARNNGFETTWRVAGKTVPIFQRAPSAHVDEVLTDDDGLSVLSWNPFHETRQEATERLRSYLDLALDEIDHRYNYSVSPDGALYGRMRTPELPRRHITWFVRWKFNDESIYGIAKADGVTENAVRKALDRVADVLRWGHRNGKGG